METDWTLLLDFWPLLLLQLVLAITALWDIRKRRSLKYLPKAAWIGIVALVSIFGPIIYFLIARGDNDERN